MKDANGTESKEHILGKEVGKELLRRKGFKEYEIDEEYTFIGNNGFKKRIDVVGINDINKIAIEVGHVQKTALKQLERSNYFNKVYNISKCSHLSVNIINKILYSYHLIIKNLKEDCERLKRLNRSLKNDSIKIQNAYYNLTKEHFQFNSQGISIGILLEEKFKETY